MAKLKEYFQGYGEVLQTVVIRDKFTGRRRGFGFVAFADSYVLDTLLQENHSSNGRVGEIST